MSRRRKHGLRGNGERGAVMVTFALFAPVAVLFASLAIDLGNSFLHKRHLQLQADAGALAAAAKFAPCENSAIEAATRQYSGVSGSPLYNAQIGNTPSSNIHEMINSKRYFNQASPVDSTAVESPPCEASMVDVKLTETNLPFLFRVAHEALTGVPYINAHSRIEVLQKRNPHGVEPLAVAESAPAAGRVYYVNEDKSNEQIASAPLTDTGPNGLGQDVWVSSAAAVPINKTNATTAHIGVIVALSGKKTDTTCGHEYVKCFDQGSTGPLMHIAGYSKEGAGTLAKPLAREVALSSTGANTCTDAYFSNSTTGCTFTIAAKVDYGSTITKGVTVTPVIGGSTGSAMTFEAGKGVWTGTATHNGAGSNEISLLVKCKKETTSACPAGNTEATIKDVHRSYAASEAGSGSITGAWLSVEGGASTDANQFQVCETADGNKCTHNLIATVDVGGSLADAQKFTDPLYHMRFGNPQSEVVGCPPPGSPSASEYRTHFSEGCPGSYKPNTEGICKEPYTEPYDCFGAKGGIKEGPFRQGLGERLQSSPPSGTKYYCPNNWVNSNGGGVPVLPQDDSRLIEVFIEPYGAAGNGPFPIQDFAAFYVTGWDGDPCTSDNSAGKAEIVGHFVKYIDTVNKNETGGEKCTLNSLGECIVVLTR